MKRIKFATVVVGAVGAPLLALGIGAGVASANTDTNPTTNDAMGFGVQNAMRDWQGVDYGQNGDQMGLGIYRSTESGQTVKSVSGRERQVEATEGGAVSLQHPDVKNGNKVEPQTKAGK